MVRARTSEWISAGWNMVVNGQNLGMFILLALIYAVVVSIASSIVFGIIVIGPVTAGAYAVILHLMRTGKFDLNRAGDGFQPFVHTMMIGILTGLFTAIGFFLCIIPGIIVSALYLFPFLLAIDRKMEFWDAMEESRKKVQEDFGGFLVFLLAIMGINLLGALLLGVGLLISIPVSLCAITIAYRELWPEQPTTIITSPIEPPSDITSPAEPPSDTTSPIEPPSPSEESGE